MSAGGDERGSRDGGGIVVVDPGDVESVVEVLVESFADYPVMRYVVGPEAPDYGERLRSLVGFFVAVRVLRGEILLGVRGAAGLDGAALVSRPGGVDTPEIQVARQGLWAELGEDARARYAAFSAATRPFEVDAPHVHLNMIGVRDRARGTGLGGRLIEHVHRLSAADPRSTGVTLTTENPANVGLYQHFGYELVGRARVAAELETWGFFRPDRGRP